MLTYLSVKNFAIIENIEVEFQDGMTSLTGETGAGKSLLIDAIGLLLGDRASTDVVRTGEKKAVVEGIFTYDNIAVDDLLTALDIPISEKQVIIKRQITTSNNNIIKINQTIVSLKDLRSITAKLADIHTQEDTLRLINPMTYLDIIDGFNLDVITPLKEQYLLSLQEYKEKKKAYLRLLKNQHELEEKIDLLKFQEKELSDYNLNIGEKEALEDEVSQMQNFDKIHNVLSEAKLLLEQTNAVDVIYDTSKKVEEIASINEQYANLSKQIESNYYDLLDQSETIGDLLSQLDYDPRLLNKNIERINDLERLEHKYKKDITELIEYLAQIRYDINNIDHYDDILVDHKNEAKEALYATIKNAQQLSAERKNVAQYIEQKLLSILADLELPNTTFNVNFNEVNDITIENDSILLDSGIDVVDFLLSTNVGEPVKPLSRSASGGEMSRIMLGFKNVLADSLGLSLMIFDEIDTGVSGYIAHQVAKKMKYIASTTQVICITHIPQVAAISDHHLHISKYVIDDRTKSSIHTLTGEDRVKEIAGMMSGENITEAALSTARELLK